MVSYVVASRYGIDTENFSLSYLAGWTQQGKELKDKEMLLNGVRTAACEFIEIIDAHFQEIEHSNECKKLIDEQLSTLRSLHYWRRNQLVAEREEDHVEVEKSNQSIRYQLEQADQLNIPFKLQNKVLHHAEHHQNENYSDMDEILSFNHCYEEGKGRRSKISSEYER